MINKQKLWFLTLFSLILVLSVYYITMPSDLMKSNNVELTNQEEDNNVVLEIKEADALDALRVTSDEERLKEMEDLRIILTNVESSTEDKIMHMKN